MPAESSPSCAVPSQDGVPIGTAVGRALGGFAVAAALIGAVGVFSSTVREMGTVAGAAALGLLYRRTDRRSTWALVAAVAGTLVGVAVGAFATRHQLPGVAVGYVCAALAALSAGVAYAVVTRSGSRRTR